MAVKDQATNLDTKSALEPQMVDGNETNNGSDQALGDYQAVTFVGHVGDYTDGDFEFKLQHADDDGDGSPDTYSDVPDDDIINGDNAESISAAGIVKLGYRGIKPHARLVVTSENVTTGASVSGLAILGDAREGTFDYMSVT